MKKYNKEKIIGILFVLIVMTLFVGLLFASPQIARKIYRNHIDNLPENSNSFDILKSAIKSAEEGINENVWGRAEIIQANGLIQRISGKKMVEDADPSKTVYKMSNGQLTFVYPEQDVMPCVDKLTELYQFLNGQGTKMLYVQAPFKNDEFDLRLPGGVEDFTNSNSNLFLKEIRKRNIPCFDTREALHQAEKPYSEMFFNTDHHWKTDAALLAVNKTMEYLNEEFGISYDKSLTQIESFTAEQYPKSFLGSQGRRVGQYYAGVDDYTLLRPAFQTNYQFVCHYSDGLREKKTGTFDDVIIHEDMLDRNSSIETNRYAAYFGGDFPLTEITNKNIKKGKVLILQDSFGLPYSAFLSLNFHQTDIIDLRHFTEQTLFGYLENNTYDLVIIAYNASIYTDTAEGIQFRFY